MDVCYNDFENLEVKEIGFNLEIYVFLLGFSFLVLRVLYLYFMSFGKYEFKTIKYEDGLKNLKLHFSTDLIINKFCQFNNFGKFSRIKIRDEVLKILNQLNEGEILIKQRFSKPKDFFEIYSFLVLKGFSFEINIYNSKYHEDFFKVLNVLQKGPHLNLKNFHWEMTFDNPQKIIKTPYFTIETSLRNKMLENKIINIKYDVKIISNPYEIPEEFINYMVQLV